MEEDLLFERIGTIDSPEYLKARILYFKNEKRNAILSANHMIKWYTKILKEIEEPKPKKINKGNK